ncbi:MAG: hypothetical protein K8H74_19405 [Notoacmeibacter sp.]|nr:hypothetical protein [Notoacmeibacter sp.]
MRLFRVSMRTMLAAAALAGAAVFASLPARAGGVHDRVYVDGYGNIVVLSVAGYKQIIVGQGYRIDEYRKAIGLGPYAEEISAPDVIYLNPRVRHGKPHRRVVVHGLSCRGGATVVRGRGYMYGLERHQVAVIPDACR